MWLLKFHIVFSVLCLLSFIGVVVVFRDRMKRFRTGTAKPKKNYFRWLIFFFPGINAIFAIVAWYMAFCDDEAVEQIRSGGGDIDAE